MRAYCCFNKNINKGLRTVAILLYFYYHCRLVFGPAPPYVSLDVHDHPTVLIAVVSQLLKRPTCGLAHSLLDND